MNAQTVRNVLKNAVKKFGVDVYKQGSVWIVPTIPDKGVNVVIDTLYYALPGDYRIETGTTINGHFWVNIWGSVKADFSVIKVSFDNVEKRDN